MALDFRPQVWVCPIDYHIALKQNGASCNSILRPASFQGAGIRVWHPLPGACQGNVSKRLPGVSSTWKSRSSRQPNVSNTGFCIWNRFMGLQELPLWNPCSAGCTCLTWCAAMQIPRRATIHRHNASASTQPFSFWLKPRGSWPENAKPATRFRVKRPQR